MLPAGGTVYGVKGYFESLRSQAPPTHSVGGESNANVKGESLAAYSSRPHLSLDVDAATDTNIAKAQGHPSIVQSPKPIRPPSAVLPLQALADGNADEEPPPDELFVMPADVESTDTAFSHSAHQKPQPPPPRRSGFPASSIVSKEAPSTSDQAPLPTNSLQTVSGRPTLQSFPAKSHHGQLTVGRQRLSNASANEQTDAARIESLANAIVASHLASSRAPSRTASPSKSPVPQLPHRVTNNVQVLHPGTVSNIAKAEARTPSPTKGMRHTMRKPPSPVDTHAELAEKHKRSHFHMRKHPHKHREGDRKRWRDEITLEERKRYEGLWAANRDSNLDLTGDHMNRSAAGSHAGKNVSGLVVRDVWSRSRLPSHVLEEIWELVDRDAAGRLDREAFVVGTWLVDQRLKGRKLPTRVGDSVWHSARGLYGLKLPKVRM